MYFLQAWNMGSTIGLSVFLVKIHWWSLGISSLDRGLDYHSLGGTFLGQGSEWRSLASTSFLWSVLWRIWQNNNTSFTICVWKMGRTLALSQVMLWSHKLEAVEKLECCDWKDGSAITKWLFPKSSLKGFLCLANEEAFSIYRGGKALGWCVGMSLGLFKARILGIMS